MYHSVGMDETDWLWSEISVSLEQFEKQLNVLKRHAYETITLNEYVEYKKNSKTKPRNKIVLTFDDGYLDNWVYVFPLLRRNSLKATIFINPQFVDLSNKIRPNLDDVWEGRCSKADLQVPGFLSWAEWTRVGLCDIICCSHGRSVRILFKGFRD